jgi:hypothetical protein
MRPPGFLNHEDTKGTKVQIRIRTFVPFVSSWFLPSGDPT